MKPYTLLLSLVLLTGFVVSPANAKEVTVRFYSESVSVQYSPSIQTDFSPIAERLSIINYYRHLETLDFEPLLASLEVERERLKLNDWLYYELLYLVINELYKKSSAVKKELTSWYILSQEGFDTRISYLSEKVNVYIYTKDELFEVAMIQEGDRTFVNLTNIYNQKVSRQELDLLYFPEAHGSRAFGFYLDNFPDLRPLKRSRQLSFYYNKATYSMKVKIDQTIIAIMQRYPVLQERKYMDIPLSSTVSGSLLPKLEHMLKDKSPTEAIKLLVAFTRSSFSYMEDEEQFGIAKPMIADEVFYYPFSDCEDRSALFYVLVKELLDLPMVIIAFEDHLTIGVALPQFEGEAIHFRGNNYYICDPTGPANTDIVGVIPSEYEDKPFEIIGYYY